MPACPVCNLDPTQVYLENAAGLAFPDAFPVTEGHTLVIPKLHVASIIEVSAPEQTALWDLVAQVRDRLLKGLCPAGFNIGVNDGQAAGQGAASPQSRSGTGPPSGTS
jgi:diadenosine tetraphosphate (Ap4A) HIT family hydrolase